VNAVKDVNAANLEACLPAGLRGPDTTITRVASGLSGAGVYRVDANGESFVLKVSGEGTSPDLWRRALRVQRLAADAGIAPRIVHVDEARRATTSAFVVDRSFPLFYRDPRTHDEALLALGRMVRRVHALPIPEDAETQDPATFLSGVWAGLHPAFTLPPFAVDAVQRVLDVQAPAREREPVLSHNDMNPSNLVYDGEGLLLFDWETAAPNDPFYDLAVLSVFLRMDEATCQRMLAAYDDAPVSALTPRFVYYRRLAATLAGVMFMHLAHGTGHAGATGTESLDTTLALSDVDARMREGALSLASSDGQWTYGLAMLKVSASL
jgi:aminoglycoside phosphotransferase (APT) family kinase protein